MKKALVVLAVVLAASGLWAQEKQEESRSAVPAVRVFTLKPGNLERVYGAVSLIAGDKGVSIDRASNTVVVRTVPEYMPAVEQVVKQLDVALPARNAELTFYILQGSRDPQADAGVLPSELQSTINQLKSAFAYQGFRLLDTAVIRARDAQESVVRGQFTIDRSPGAATVGYWLALKPSIVGDVTPAVVRIDRLRFTVQIPNKGEIGFTADVDIKEGQKVVIGKSGIEGNQSALILVAVGKIVE